MPLIRVEAKYLILISNKPSERGNATSSAVILHSNLEVHYRNFIFPVQRVILQGRRHFERS